MTTGPVTSTADGTPVGGATTTDDGTAMGPQGGEIPEFTMVADIAMSQDERFHLNAMIETSGIAVSMEMILDGDSVYMMLPGLPDWYKIDTTSTAATGLPLDDLRQFSSPQPYMLGNPALDAMTFEEIGRELIDGVETTHISIEMDFVELWQTMTPEEQVQMFGETLSEQEMQTMLEETEYRTFDLWIDDEGHVRRTLIEMVLAGETVSTIEMTMTDFNEVIIIELPVNFIEGLPGQAPSPTPTPST